MWGSKVFQENLDSFLAIAEELQLKGLMGKTKNERVQDFEEKEKPQPFLPVTSSDRTFQKTSFQRKNSFLEENRTLAIPDDFSGDLGELEEKVKSMMEKSQNKIASGL